MVAVQEQSKLDTYDYFLWRPVMLKKALKWELGTSAWTLNDLVTFHEMQDIEDALQEESYAKVNEK
jgi:hypothetical protein